MVLGIAALTIDMAVVRLTQIQMQNAADTAALEGLRKRDAISDPVVADRIRRTDACRMSAWTFDDAFRDHCLPGEVPFAPLSSVPPGGTWLGAGPEVGLVDNPQGGEMKAMQTIVPAASGAYKPVLQSNNFNGANGNFKHGDMVSGQFGPQTYGNNPNCPSPNPNAFPEDCDFNRADFAPLTSPPAPPPIPRASSLGSSFLVRMRRADGRNPLDQDSNNNPADGVSSSGSSLPLMFGRTLPIQANANGYSPRRDGITTRATAIADSGGPGVLQGTAMRVGPRVCQAGFQGQQNPVACPNPVLIGTAFFALNDIFWNGLRDGEICTITQDDGDLFAEGQCSLTTDFAGIMAEPIMRTVGMEVHRIVGNNPGGFKQNANDEIPDAYSPIYHGYTALGPVPIDIPIVIGFAAVQILSDPGVGCHKNPAKNGCPHFRLRRLGSQIAAGNATGILAATSPNPGTGGLPPDFLAVTDIGHLLQLTVNLGGKLMAPVIVK